MKILHRKNSFFLSLILMLSLSLTGCGAGNQEPQPPLNDPTPELPRQTVDWSELQLTAAQDETDGVQWNLREFYDDWITYPDTYDMKFASFYSSPNGDICAETQYAILNEDGRTAANTWNCLDYFDTETREALHASVDYDEWGVPNTNLTQVDVVDDKLVACYFCSSEDVGASRSHCTLVFYHMENGVQKSLDLLPALTAAEMADSIDLFSEENVLCDREGCCYLVLPDKILVISETGELLHCADRELSDRATLSYLCKTPQGFPLFVCRDLSNRSNTYWIYDHDAGEMRSLGKSGYKSQDYGCVNSCGELFYFSNGNVVCWNTLTGAQEKIFDCQANNICSNLSAKKHMTIREDGDLVILDPMTENKCIYVLSSTPPEPDKVLTLVSTLYAQQLEQTAAAYFSMKKPGVSIEFSDIPEGVDRSTHTNNLINRIVAGDAPDMFIVSSETMHILYEKGVLADLSDAIPKELREQVFDCIWNAGTIDGKLMGLTTGVGSSTMLVSEEVWPQDTWTLEDILTLAENAPKDTLKGLIPMADYEPSPSRLLYWLALQDIDSSLVDRENGVCHFDCETFRKLLEYCKNTPYPETEFHFQDPAPAQEVINGEYLAYPCSNMGSFMFFGDQMALFPENYHCVGVPTERESGNLVYTGGFLVVNKNSENMDLIMEFLPILYGDEISRKFPWQCLRRDVLRSRVIIPDWDSTPQFNQGEGVYLILPSKPDGTSYVEDYIAYMDSCILAPVKDEMVADIVLEEVEPYFAGDKDIDTVIDIIQSRVQLYLNENGS